MVLSENKYLYQSGLTVNNALIPRRGSSELSLAYDDSKSLFAFYGYSISNVFQIEFANLAISVVHSSLKHISINFSVL